MAKVRPALKIRIDRKVFPALGKREANEVLRDVDIGVDQGSFVILTGPSGCGKSTLLNIVAGLDGDYQGRIELMRPETRIGYIFQSPRLLPWRTVEENIRLVLDGDDPRQGEVPAMLERVGLSEAANAYPERVSLGMQRRAALARGFITEPDILLMDEPFVSLDDPTAQDLRQLLIDLWSRRPTTVLFVTHDRAEAVTLGTRILRLEPGSASIVQDEVVRLTPEERSDRSKVRAEQARIFGDA